MSSADPSLRNLLTQEAVKVILLAVGTSCAGWAVRRGLARVNYVRKVFHFVLFGVPWMMQPWFPVTPAWWTSAITVSVLIACLIAITRPVRSRVRLLDLAFASIDRPEDRPHTLLLLWTQIAATYAVIFPMAWWLRQYHRESMMWIPIVVTGIGDGLAEPVGVRFGRHRYRTPSLLATGVYTRSWEGSACVFITAAIAVIALRSSFDSNELLLALIFVPPLMTLAEAWSPHTWDGPLLYLMGGLAPIACFEAAARLP